MKTLQESLFDSNLHEKNPSLRSLYKIRSKRGMDVSGLNILNFFSAIKLSKYPFLYDRDNLNLLTPTAGLFGIIVDMPVPTNEDFIKDEKSKWSKTLKDKLSKYILPSYRDMYDDVDIWIDEDDKNYDFRVQFIFDHGAGITSLYFEKL